MSSEVLVDFLETVSNPESVKDVLKKAKAFGFVRSVVGRGGGWHATEKAICIVGRPNGSGEEETG